MIKINKKIFIYQFSQLLIAFNFFIFLTSIKFEVNYFLISCLFGIGFFLNFKIKSKNLAILASGILFIHLIMALLAIYMAGINTIYNYPFYYFVYSNLSVGFLTYELISTYDSRD